MAVLTFQQLRDWHAAQINNKAFHNEAVRLLNSLIDDGTPVGVPFDESERFWNEHFFNR